MDRMDRDGHNGGLRAGREPLLPKLLSSELRAPDGERMVGRCT